MAIDRKFGLGALRASKARFLMVSLGIALFVSGFILTVASFSKTSVGGSQDGSGVPLSVKSGRFGAATDMFVLAGIMTSMAGVAIATVGPAVSVMQGKDRILR